METKYKHTILYIHGMGGGRDSRIPAILSDYFKCQGGACCDVRASVEVVVRTYDFDPDIARVQIEGWYGELKPDLVIGESMGANHALRMQTDVPRLYVSPAVGAPFYLGYLSFFGRLPFICRILEKKFSPREGDRQTIYFNHEVMSHFLTLRKDVMSALREASLHPSLHFAFFGKSDHYLKSGIVNPRQWRKYVGEDSCVQYDGTHFMEEEYIYSLLIPEIVKRLEIH